MSLAESAIFAVYYGALMLLVFYGAHRLVLTAALLRRGEEPPAALPAELPRVTVQLPMYNERHVAERVIRAAAALDYPADRLQVQVLDDSTDDTRRIVDRVAAELSDAGVRVDVVRRTSRGGFKAGALEHGLASATGSLIAVFDADFAPTPDFLRAVVGHFDDAEVGMVQARWGHLNRGASLLTRAQAVLLDGHFVVEQTARSTGNVCFNFNGTAGVWRRVAIEDAGGWQHDTITEDLDLSYRAQLAGWRFVYRTDVVAPAQLPEALTAFKSQQHRWAKGSIECLRKLAGVVVRRGGSLRRRVEALIHLTANASYVLMLVVALTMPLLVRARQAAPIPWAARADAALLLVGGLSMFAFYGCAMARQRERLLESLVAVPLALLLDIGMCVHKSRAVLEAAVGHRSGFVRTPKLALTPRRGSTVADAYVRRSISAGALELVMAAWMLHGAWRVYTGPHPSLWALPFLLVFALGFLFVGGVALVQALPTLPRRTELRAQPTR